MTSVIYFLYRFGILGFGVYPLGLELSVEASYPVDEAAGTALIFLSGQVQGGILVLFAQILAQDLNEEAQEIEVRFIHLQKRFLYGIIEEKISAQLMTNCGIDS